MLTPLTRNKNKKNQISFNKPKEIYQSEMTPTVVETNKASTVQIENDTKVFEN